MTWATARTSVHPYRATHETPHTAGRSSAPAHARTAEARSPCGRVPPAVGSSVHFVNNSRNPLVRPSRPAVSERHGVSNTPQEGHDHRLLHAIAFGQRVTQ